MSTMRMKLFGFITVLYFLMISVENAPIEMDYNPVKLSPEEIEFNQKGGSVNTANNNDQKSNNSPLLKLMNEERHFGDNNNMKNNKKNDEQFLQEKKIVEQKFAESTKAVEVGIQANLERTEIKSNEIPKNLEKNQVLSTKIDLVPSKSSEKMFDGPTTTTTTTTTTTITERKTTEIPKVVEIPQQTKSSSTESLMDVSIIIPTVRRFQHDRTPAPEKYLATLVNKLWGDLSEEDRKHVHFYILNADKEPELHVEALSLIDHPAVTLFIKKDNISEIMSNVGDFEQMEDGRVVSYDWLSWVASENVDAAFLMEKTKAKTPYILFLEDDVYPTSNALHKLNQFLRDVSPHDDWLFLDLYTPNLDWAPGMLDVANGERYPFQCCTQSMLFRSDRVDDIINYLRSHPKEPIDDNLRFYMKNVRPDLFVYAARPNLFEHVGAYSSNPAKSTGVVEHTSLEFIPLLL